MKRANEEKVVKPLVKLTKLPDGSFRYGDGSAYPDARLFEDVDVIPVVFVEKQPDGSYEYVEAGEVDVTWSDIQGKPSTFPPSAHTHDIADVNGLQAALDSKLTATQAAAVTDSTGATDTVLEAKVNELLASLRAAGILSE